MRIQDFTDMDKFHEIMKNWARATGLATVAVDMDGNYISDCFNFTDFCIKYTRESAEGKRRCEKCDREGTGVYHCHAGLVDFSIDLVVKGEKSEPLSVDRYCQKIRTKRNSARLQEN